jgi:glycosyltransferase involved in cell wall biosynthesis
LSRVAVIGPVYPYRAGIAYCTTRLAEELARHHKVQTISFSRQYPRRFYPGKDDIDESLRPKTPRGARFALDILNPFTWLWTALRLRLDRPDTVVLVWWIWVWALPYRLILALLPRKTRVIIQCHNIQDKEPSSWKTTLSNLVLRRGDVLVVHAQPEADVAAHRIPGKAIVKTFLPVHELGGVIPSKEEARLKLGIAPDQKIALFFGHVRPFKGLDIALRAWRDVRSGALLLVAGEAWWKSEQEYRDLARKLALQVIPSLAERQAAATLDLVKDDLSDDRPAVTFDFRFIPDSEIATFFAASDVILAPYRVEAQSGVALTAFHFRRPVIASAVGGLPEIIEDGLNGLLVPPEDPRALGRAIDAFFGGLDDMTAGAAESATRYSWAEYAAVIERLL